MAREARYYRFESSQAEIKRALEVLDAAEKLAAIVRELNNPKNWMFHDCKGPSCRLCMKLPDALADYDALFEEEYSDG